MMTESTPIETLKPFQFNGEPLFSTLSWQGPAGSIAFDPDEIKDRLLALDKTAYLVRLNGQLGLTNEGAATVGEDGTAELLAISPALPLGQMGDAGFRADYGLKYAYSSGAMANGIASEAMVIALGKAGFLGSFGSAGLGPARIEAAIRRIQETLPHGPYAFNLIHSPSEEAMERNAVDLFLRHNVTTVEASAFLGLTPSIVYYRAAGLSVDPCGDIGVKNRVIAKVSRKEVATRFLEPAPLKILQQLVADGRITELQANLAQQVPMADDITVEADSGGHTDNRPLVALIPTMLALRDEIQAKYGFRKPTRIGAAGGISHPAAVLGAFSMGAAYVVTGTINQACVEAGASEHTRELLAKAAMTEVIMAPAADMFEMGVRVQVLKSGTLFPMRASKLYELYNRYESLEAIPAEERDKLEKQIFQRSLDSVWDECVKFFTERDPDQIARAKDNPKRRMALVFRWYLGLSSRWSNNGEKGREMDYQIWCGPAIGPFNDWTRNTYMAEPANRRVVDVALHLMTGAAFLSRAQNLKMQGLQIPAGFETYSPTTPMA